MLDFFQGMQTIAQKLPTVTDTTKFKSFLPFVVLGDEITLIQSTEKLSKKILNKQYPSIQIKSFELENSQSSCDELSFLMQEQDLFSETNWFFIHLQKTGKYINPFLKELHKKALQKNYHIFLPHLDKASKESPWFNEFSKHHYCIYLPKLNLQPQFFRQWLNFEAAQHRLDLSIDCIPLLEQNCRHNLVQAKQILKQLYFAYGLQTDQDRAYITLNQLKPYLGQHSEYQFADVLQAMWLGQSTKMLLACEYLMQQETPHLLIWLLNDDFLKLHALFDQKQKTGSYQFKSLNIWGDRQKALNRAANLYTAKEINAFWQQLLELERQAKGIDNFHANIWQPLISLFLKFIKVQGQF
jgi:DNA polymerase III delta subunit